MRRNQRRTILQVLVIAAAFFGIEVFWNLQYANMSGVYYLLGASTGILPLLSIPGVLAGLVIPPVVGKLSDKTWCRLGRRKPYFLFGGLAGCVAILFIPASTGLFEVVMAAFIASIALNVCGPACMAYVSDSLNRDQVTLGYSVQSVMVALAAISAAGLPWVFRNVFLVQTTGELGEIPLTIQLSFYWGAIVLLGTILVSVIFGAEESPPQSKREKALQLEPNEPLGGDEPHRDAGVKPALRELYRDFMKMPKAIRDLNLVVSFVWAGLSVMFIYLPLDVAIRIYNGKNQPVLFAQGIEWTGLCFSVHSIVSFFASLIFPTLCRHFSNKSVFFTTNLCGFLGLISIVGMTRNTHVLPAMIGTGILIAGVFIIPYAVIAGVLPTRKHGTYMGITNVFVTLPGILIGSFIGPLMKYAFHDNTMIAIILAAFFVLIASGLTLRMDKRLH